MFTLDNLRIDCPRKSSGTTGDVIVQNRDVHEMLRSGARRVEFRVLEREFRLDDPIAMGNMLAPMLALCTSARELVFNGLLWTRMKIFEQVQAQGVPKTVEELTIRITTLPLQRGWFNEPIRKVIAPAMEQFSLNDDTLSQALILGLAPGLRVLKVLFLEEGEVNEFFKNYLLGHEGRLHLLLPRCRQICSERDIKFTVDTNFGRM